MKIQLNARKKIIIVFTFYIYSVQLDKCINNVILHLKKIFLSIIINDKKLKIVLWYKFSKKNVFPKLNFHLKIS